MEAQSKIILNITQAIAIVVAGWWTYYQWNKTIFPQAERVELKELAEFETSFEFEDFRQESKTFVNKEYDRYFGLMRFAVRLENNRPFPIEFTVLRVRIQRSSIRFVEVEGDAARDGIPNFEWEDLKIFKPDYVYPVFSEKESVVVSSGSHFDLSGMVPLDLNSGSSLVGFRVLSELSLVPLGPAGKEKLATDKSQILINSDVFIVSDIETDAPRSIFRRNPDRLDHGFGGGGGR